MLPDLKAHSDVPLPPRRYCLACSTCNQSTATGKLIQYQLYLAITGLRGSQWRFMYDIIIGKPLSARKLAKLMKGERSEEV